ncbi:cubilin-like [Liolophura sinensis]|uniref:cubilin-like n=1 Tax=Liolophura sinensis TaxID=3198878 RepID=UPI00315938C7
MSKTDRYALFHLEDLGLSGSKASLMIYSGNATHTQNAAEIVANFSQTSEVRPVITSDNVTTVILYTGSWPLQNMTARLKMHYEISSDCRQKMKVWTTKVKSPLFSQGALPLKCSYDIEGQNSHMNFTVSFEEFKLTKGHLIMKHDNETLQNFTGTKMPDDVFTKGDNLLLEFTTDSKDVEKFTAVVSSVNADCLYNLTLNNSGTPVPLVIPDSVQSPLTCRWVLSVPKDYTIRVSADQSSLTSSRLMVSEGRSLFGSKIRVILGDPETGKSFVSKKDSVSVYLSVDPSLIHGQLHITATPQQYGGVFYHNGSLEGHGVDFDGSSEWHYNLISLAKQKVRFVITNSSLFPASSIRCYDGLTESSPLLAEFRSDRTFYPVVSSGTQMLVVASNLELRGFFTAEFTSTLEECDKISQGYQGHYYGNMTLPEGSEDKVCSWIIQPITDESGVFLIRASMSGIHESDNLKLYDGLSEYNLNVFLAKGDKHGSSANLPVVIIPAQTGARLSLVVDDNNGTANNYTRIVKADYSFSSDRICGGVLAPGMAGHILSPFYPNEHYPLNLRCEWNTTVVKEKLLYITFNTFDVAPEHTVNVLQYVNETEITEGSRLRFNGSVVPSDVILKGPRVNVTFNTEKLHQGGNSGRGFNVSYRTLDCGGRLTSRKTELSTPGFPTHVSSTTECIWIIEVPLNVSLNNSVPVLSINIDLEGFSNTSRSNFLQFRDGNSLHAPISNIKLTNGKTTGLHSRTNKFWIRYIYQLHNSPSNAPGFAFKMSYTTYDCPRSQQCDNRICMQPSWKCDGIDQCGDESDEKNCSSTITTTTGVAGFVVAILMIVGFALGVIAAVVAPAVYKRIRYPNYTHLRDIVSPIET